MPQTSHIPLPYPNNRDRNWYEEFTAFADAVDLSLYSRVEDNNIIISGGGNFSWSDGTDVLVWSEGIDIFSAVVGFNWTIAAGSVEIPDGSVAFVQVTRAPTGNIALVLEVDTNMSSANKNLGLLIFHRRGDVIYCRNGRTIGEGESLVALLSATAGGGSATYNDLVVTGNISADSFTGPLTGDSTGQHTGDIVVTDAAQGLRFGSSAGAFIQAPPPTTNAQFEAMSGLTSAAWWRLDWLNTGNAPSQGDVAATLSAGGSPTYQALKAGKVGIHFDGGTGDGMAANVLDVTTDSFIFGARVGFMTDPAGTSHTLIGRFNASIANGWVIATDDSGNIFYYINDGVNPAFQGFPTAFNGILTLNSPELDLVGQIDRSGASPVLRLRGSRHGVLVASTEVTLTGLGTLTGANQVFGFGAIPVASPAYNGGAWVQWGFLGTGAQAEGATRPQLVSQGLGWE